MSKMCYENVIVIIPALNEEKTIDAVIKSAKQIAVVLVVDDGSWDTTSVVAKKAGAIVHTLPKNKGVDGALAEGYKKAEELGYEIVATIDADGQHDPRQLKLIIEPVVQGKADICHSIRLNYARPTEWLLRKYSYFKHGYRDILSGLKCFRLNILLSDPSLASMKTLGTAVPWLAWKQKARIEQIEITIGKREDTPRVGGLLLSNLRVIKALFRLIYWDLIKK
jgi:glycosyltransferase involved in cell wall biosynthesis